MNQIVVRGKTEAEVLYKIKKTYGSDYIVKNKKYIPAKGLRGVFNKTAQDVEYFITISSVPGMISSVMAGNQKNLDMSERDKIISMAGLADKMDQTEITKESSGKRNKHMFDEPGQDAILTELASLKEKIDGVVGGVKKEPESLEHVEDLLGENDFTPKYIREIKMRLKNELSLTQLEDWDQVSEAMTSMISQSIKIFREEERDGPRIIILVGPTGVGKTTTIAKLAAGFSILAEDGKNKSVRIITIDGFRIGAGVQVKKYGEIMNIPVYTAEDTNELKKQIDLNSTADIIFIDTTGRGHKDYMKLAEMKKTLEGCGHKSEVHLVVSSQVKSSDMKETLVQFGFFKYRSVIVSKVDETDSIGNVISLLHEMDKAISYITTGQNVPSDIERATSSILMEKLKGFEFKYDNLDESV